MRAITLEKRRDTAPKIGYYIFGAVSEGVLPQLYDPAIVDTAAGWVLAA